MPLTDFTRLINAQEQMNTKTNEISPSKEETFVILHRLVLTD